MLRQETFPDVSVLIATRRRPVLLQRAIQSVFQQDYMGKLCVYILIDDCQNTASMLSQKYGDSPNIEWRFRRRRNEEVSGPPQLARLRNELVTWCETRWFHFLDDDVTFSSNHTRSLVEHAIQNDYEAVHSWMRVFNFDGSPYTECRWPWCRDPSTGRKRYADFLKSGVVTIGNNVIRDSTTNLPERCVDANEWLLDSNLIRKNPIPTCFSDLDWIHNKSEDDKLLYQLLSLEIQIGCSKLPTVNYFLGGFSNNHDRSHSHTEPWEWSSDNYAN